MLANTYGEVDKEPFEVRQQWAADNEEMILLCGRNFKDPKAFDFWRKADDPLQFLAACREWFNASEADKRGEALRRTSHCSRRYAVRDSGFTPQWAGTLMMASV